MLFQWFLHLQMQALSQKIPLMYSLVIEHGCWKIPHLVPWFSEKCSHLNCKLHFHRGFCSHVWWHQRVLGFCVGCAPSFCLVTRRLPNAMWGRWWSPWKGSLSAEGGIHKKRDSKDLESTNMGTWSNLEQHEGFRYFMCLSAGSIRCANISSLWFYGDQSTTLRNPKPGTSNEAKKFRDELAEETRMALCWVVYHAFPVYLKSVTFEKENTHLNAVASNVKAVAFPCVMLSQKSNGILVMFPYLCLFHLIPSSVEGHELETLNQLCDHYACFQVPKILLSYGCLFSA